MSLLLDVIVTYIKENIIKKLQKWYSQPRNPRVGNKSPVLFVKKSLCMGNLLPACKVFIERSVIVIVATILVIIIKAKIAIIIMIKNNH